MRTTICGSWRNQLKQIMACHGQQDNGNGSLMRILSICLYAVEKQKKKKKKNISDVQVLKNVILWCDLFRDFGVTVEQ